VIITRPKPFEKVVASLPGRVFVVGCGTCATLCQTGGEEQVKAMVSRLEGRVTGSAVVESPCDLRLVKRDLKGSRPMVDEAEAVLALCCGAGAQVLAEYTGKILIPCLDTLFIGKTERIGRFYERCRACTDCLLYETGGICPVTMCSKGLINGPCGGAAEGKCEVGGYRWDCAWTKIYDALKRQGRLGHLKFRPPRDRSGKAHPQEIVG